VSIATQGRDLDRRRRLGGLGASDREGASLVTARDPARSFHAVEAGALGGAERLVAQLRVANRGAPHREQELHGDSVSVELVVRESGRD
jgi:hypothetical protein